MTMVDSARAFFDMKNGEAFIAVQATAMRVLASPFPSDAWEGESSLGGDPENSAQSLGVELQKRLKVAGVGVLGARPSQLAFAPDIAPAMMGAGKRKPPSRART
ncbi:MAG: hypothetical protein ACP5NF_07250 [Thermoanaerobaculum sp.]